MIPLMRRRIEEFRHRKFVGVAELANAATAILSEGAPVQERASVSEYPDERNVRYYLSEGLLSPSEEKQGTASVFGYLHLLQLLVIKHLQAEHIPIKRIRGLVEGCNQRELERLLPEMEEDARTQAEAIDYLEGLLTGPKQSAPSLPAFRRLAAPGVTPQAQASQMVAGSQPIDDTRTQAEVWERVQIEPGLELHIREDFEMPAGAKAENRIVTSILELLRRLKR